ncbi:uncharacterized protein LODBEIA_P15790 [Lodderomyces beijingensis]|uniref:Man(5)GlcNAc(2)-PP-dolichol translocation protein RFT1 n=1 Tax=Lodderomyces beijingensis TaxID=1775926 RepID=A0ABP0ZJI5_9ASCO
MTKAVLKHKENVVELSAKGISSLVLVQVVTKLFTFILNQGLVRFITPQVFGLAAYVELLQSTILFFSREAVRLSAQRIPQRKTKWKSLQETINLGFLAIVIGAPVTLVVGYVQGYRSANFQDHLLHLPFSRIAIGLLLASVALELAIEPIYCLYQYELKFSERSKYEGVAVFVKCAVTFFGVGILSRKLFVVGNEFDGAAVLSFASGQFAYALTLAVLYSNSFVKYRNVKNLPVRYALHRVVASHSKCFDAGVLQIFKGFFVQMIFKQLLTEGDKIVISHVCTIEEQGTYAVISNYGSIIARLLFQPLEESTRLMLTKITTAVTKTKEDTVAQSFTYIKMISLFYFNLCLCILLAGVTNGPFLLKFMLGARGHWADTNIFELFALYVAYMPFLAFNGVLEAFFTSLGTSRDLQKYSLFMTLLTVAILGMSYCLISVLNLGLQGLLFANMANMSMRIGYCFLALRNYYSATDYKLSLRTVLHYIGPSVFTLVVVWVGQYLFVFHRESILTKDWIELGKSAICSIYLLANLMILERKNLSHTVAKVFKIKDL